LPLNILFAQFDSTAIITEDVLDNILDETDEEVDNSELVDIIEEFTRNPIDINTADVIELTKLPDLDQQSAELIIEHRKKFGPYFSVNELYAIQNLDKQVIQSILPFIKVSKLMNTMNNLRILMLNQNLF
jgi:DNA uptake protein and related DNA-binding proteins